VGEQAVRRRHGAYPRSARYGQFFVGPPQVWIPALLNILRFNQSDTIAQDRYAAALGGLEALSDMNYYKER
jgi:hypothetical protein